MKKRLTDNVVAYCAVGRVRPNMFTYSKGKQRCKVNVNKQQIYAPKILEWSQGKTEHS